MRAVLDPNVLISALLSARGAPGQILLRWLAGEFELIVSDLLLAELARALAYPKLRARIPAEDASAFVAMLRREAVLVADPPSPAPRSTDPGDDYLLALAEAQDVPLVSGDAHLLALAGRMPIQSAREFLEHLEGR